MKLHAILASATLLEPERWPDAALNALGGRPTAPPSAFWLGRSCSGACHDYLLSELDARLRVFAQALREDFGARVEPVVVFNRLGDAPAELRPKTSLAPATALARLARAAAIQTVVLHDVALAPGIDPEGIVEQLDRPARLDRVMTALADAGLAPERVEVTPLVLASGAPALHPALLNALAHWIAQEAPPSERRAGLVLADRPAVEKALRAALGGSLARGFTPSTPLEPGALAQLGARLLDRIAEGDCLESS